MLTPLSIDLEYVETMALLKDALDYLIRLPPHPMTRKQIMKIEAHIADPVRRVTAARAEVVSRRLIGGDYSPAGLQLLAAALNGNRLSISSPAIQSSGGRREVGERVLDRLRQGVEIEMTSNGLRRTE